MDQPGFVPTTTENVIEITTRTWNALAQSANGHRTGQQPGPKSDPLTLPVNVQNKTGSDINSAYRAFSLGEPVWTIGTNKLPQCCFRLETYDATKPVAIIQQPLIVDEVGLAVVVGPSLVDVTGAGSSSDRKGSPDATGQIIPGTGDKVQFAGSRPTGGGRVLALLGVSSGALVRIFRTPSGGIAANSNATCDELSEDRTTVTGSSVVHNHKSAIIPGSVDVLVMSSGSRLWVVEPNCPTVITEP